MKNAFAFEPERSPGIGETAKKIPRLVLGKSKTQYRRDWAFILESGDPMLLSALESFYLMARGTSGTLAPANKTGHKRINYAKVYTTKF